MTGSLRIVVARKRSGIRWFISKAWQTLELREGAKGPLVFQFAAVRVWAMRHKKPGPPIWLVLRRSLAKNPEVKYYVSKADEQTPLETMALVTGTRWRVEEFFEDGKGDFGMADYEARAWTSWHHHMTLVALAHLFITSTRQELQEETPELSLPLGYMTPAEFSARWGPCSPTRTLITGGTEMGAGY